MKKWIVLLLISSVGLFELHAQNDYITNETTHVISNKSERGYLANVETDETLKEIRLYFITKVKSKKIKVETYYFDFDLKFLKTQAEEFDNGKSVKLKFSWFNFRNSDYETFVGVTADPNMLGNMVFRKREITSYFSWFTGGYKTSVKYLDKLKPKGEDGNKYFYFTHFDNDVTGEVLAVVGPKDNRNQDRMYTDYSLMRVDVNLDIKSNEKIGFTVPQYLIYSGIIQSDNYADGDLYTGDYAMVFAPLDQGGIQNPDPNAANYTYVRVSPEGKVKEKIQFTTKAAKWRIEGLYEINAKVYAYGPGKKIGKTKDAYGNSKNYAPEDMEKGFDNFQVTAFANGKAEFVNAPNMDEIAAKTVGPDGQKKVRPYEGGRIKVTGITPCSNGDLLIQAQMMNINFISKERVYKDFLLFQFDVAGQMKRSYSIDSPAKGGFAAATDPFASPSIYASKSEIIMGNNGATVYWMTGLVTKVDKVESSSYLSFGYTNITTSYTPREQLILSRINIETGKMEAVQKAGEGLKNKKEFYLMPSNRYTLYNGGTRMLILGEDASGASLFGKGNNYIYLGSMDFQKM